MAALDLRLANEIPGSIGYKLKLRGDALWDMGASMHEAFRHPGAFGECQNANCSGVRQILDLTNEPFNQAYKRT